MRRARNEFFDSQLSSSSWFLSVSSAITIIFKTLLNLLSVLKTEGVRDRLIEYVSGLIHLLRVPFPTMSQLPIRWIFIGKGDQSE